MTDKYHGSGIAPVIGDYENVLAMSYNPLVQPSGNVLADYLKSNGMYNRVAANYEGLLGAGSIAAGAAMGFPAGLLAAGHGLYRLNNAYQGLGLAGNYDKASEMWRDTDFVLPRWANPLSPEYTHRQSGMSQDRAAQFALLPLNGGKR